MSDVIADRMVMTASQLASTVISRVEVADFSLAGPDLSSIVKQIYGGVLPKEVIQ